MWFMLYYDQIANVLQTFDFTRFYFYNLVLRKYVLVRSDEANNMFGILKCHDTNNSASSTLCEGNHRSLGFPDQGPLTRNFDMSFVISRNKLLNEQFSWGTF